jgi:hypothetical protein
MLGRELRRSDSVILKALNDRYWAFNTKNGAQYNLNEMSYSILALLSSPVRFEAVVDSVCQRYDGTNDAASADIEKLIKYCLNKAILIEIDGKEEQV